MGSATPPGGRSTGTRIRFEYIVFARARLSRVSMKLFLNDPSGRTQHKDTIHKYDHLVTTQNDCWSIWQTRANAVFARRRRRIHLRFGVLNTPLHTLLHLPAHQTKVPNAPPFQIACLHWPCSLQAHPARLPGPSFTGSSYTISYIMRPERRRGMNLVMVALVGQERRASEAFLVLRPVREVGVNGDTLPTKPQYAL